MSVRTSKKGKIFRSDATGNVYRVFKWKELEDGKIIALKKELVEEWEEPKEGVNSNENI